MKLFKTIIEDLTHPEVCQALRETLRSYSFWGLFGIGYGWAYCYARSLGAELNPLLFLSVLINGSFFALLAAIAVTDLKRFIVPDLLVYPLFIFGLIVAPHFKAALIASFILGAGFALVRWFSSKLAKQEAMGLGDVKLVIALGPWVGLLGIVPMLLITSLIALIVVLGRVLLCKERSALPFAPFLVFGAWAAYGYGPMVVAYLFIFRQSLVGLM